jgi:UDP-2-acetamido-2,6-beta-L-arabino-hexul-4-ose reductase
MKIAITGEKGFVGTHLRLYIEKIINNEFIELGKDYLNSIDKLNGADWLIHCASVHRLPNPEMVLSENVRIHSELIRDLVIKNISINIVFLSSIQENDDTFYGESKREGKRMLSEYCKSVNKKFISYSLPNLFGPYAKPYRYSFIATFCYNAINEIESTYNKKDIDLCFVTNAVRNILLFDSEAKFQSVRKTVEEVYYTIQQFHKLFNDSHVIPLFNNEFEFNLFYTYLSYRQYIINYNINQL